MALALPLSAADNNPPDRMTYQGFLADANGNPLGPSANGPQNFTANFRIYTAATGGTPLWAEQQTITVDNGFFSIVLGEGSSVSGEDRPSLSEVFTGASLSERYIGITIIPSSGNASEILPRLRLVTTPFAFTARQAVSVVDQNGEPLLTTSGNFVGINKPVASAPLDVGGTVNSTGLAVSGPATVDSLAVNGQATAKSLTTMDSFIAHNDSALHRVKVTTSVDVGQNVTAAGLDITGTASANTLNVSGALSAGSMSAASLKVNGPLSADSVAGPGTIPVGGIIMWSGAQIPGGWALCNGNTVNGVQTPDLQDRFIVGSGRIYPVGSVGGVSKVTLTTEQMPSHTHSHVDGFFAESGGNDASFGQVFGTGAKTDGDNHIYTVPRNTAPAGGNKAVDILPPYYALAYIMRVQ